MQLLQMRKESLKKVRLVQDKLDFFFFATAKVASITAMIYFDIFIHIIIRVTLKPLLRTSLRITIP